MSIVQHHIETTCQFCLLLLKSRDSQNSPELPRYSVLSRSIAVLIIRSTRYNKWSSPLVHILAHPNCIISLPLDFPIVFPKLVNNKRIIVANPMNVQVYYIHACI